MTEEGAGELHYRSLQAMFLASYKLVSKGIWPMRSTATDWTAEGIIQNLLFFSASGGNSTMAMMPAPDPCYQHH